MIAEYLVADKDLRLTEVRLEDAKAANKMLKLRLTLLGTCKFLKKLHYNGKKAGRSFECTKPESYTQVYSFGEKFYEISSELRTTVQLFVGRVLPLSSHLQGSKECISMYY